MSPLQMRKLMRKLKHRVKLFAEKAMAPRSSTLAWKIPWMKEPDRLRSMGSRSRTRLSDFTFTLHFPALEKEMATHSRVLAWRIPETGEPGGLPSLGLHRVGHDWSDLAAAAANAMYLGSIPGPGRFHMSQGSWTPAPQLLSLRSRAHEPQLLNPRT